MAGTGYDALDNCSEIAAATGVSPSVPTPSDNPSSPIESHLLQMAAIDDTDSVPLESMALGKPGNEIDVENLSIFELLNQVFPVSPTLRRSKQKAGYDPELVPSKKFKRKGEASSSPFIIDPDFSSGDDSEDADFELVARPKRTASLKNIGSSETHKSPSLDDKAVASEEPTNDVEEEESLVEFLMILKEAKA